ncbi:hypothetical protein NSMM_640008 [Nitrosomonas mobilis]|uniref:Uncharacterized protein n=1 Tax=Nitrosomonas mobilis TaxID=51642 RepID=A0A1G5SHJ8_9PROT|nr:hypothetical protein NSMM_640008 [Nitrosomonas mobilis]
MGWRIRLWRVTSPVFFKDVGLLQISFGYAGGNLIAMMLKNCNVFLH